MNVNLTVRLYIVHMILQVYLETASLLVTSPFATQLALGVTKQ